jgi:hypothetical protein
MPETASHDGTSGSILYPTAEVSKKKHADIVGHIQDDYQFAMDGRREREDQIYRYWKMYLQEPRKRRVRGRSNSVGPHGGLIIRTLVPLIKRAIFSTRPFIRGVPTKRELLDMMPLLEARLDQWIDNARIRTIVMTHMLKEALALGTSWGKVQHVMRTRPFVERSLGYDESGDIEVQKALSEEVTYEGPWVTYVPWEDAYPFPMARDLTELETSGYFIHRFFKTRSELLDDPMYEDKDAIRSLGHLAGKGNRSAAIPIDRIFEEQRRRILGLNVDEFRLATDRMRTRGDEPVEVLEIIAQGSLYALGNRSTIIREESLDHPMPLFSLCPDPIPGEIFGKSVYHDACSSIDQRDFVMNNVFDNLARLVHQMYLGVPNQYDETTLVPRPGGVIHVRSLDMFQPIPQVNTVQGALPVVTLIDRDIQAASGVSEILSTIGAGSGTVYPETATGAEIQQSNATAFLGEMIQQIEEDGVKRMVSIMFDIEREFLAEDDWIRLAGEEGARWKDVDPDTLARDVDWQIIGSSYAANKQAEAQAATAFFDRMLQLHTIDQSIVDLRELANSLGSSLSAPNVDRIVTGSPRDMGPEAEHRVMQEGIPVKPERDEDLMTHMQAHLGEVDRVMSEDGVAEADPGYVERLLEHVTSTRDLIMRAQQEQQIALAAAGGGGNGEVQSSAEEGAGQTASAGAGDSRSGPANAPQ